MTPKEMIILHFGFYFGQKRPLEESVERMVGLAKALKIPIDDYDKILRDVHHSMQGMLILKPITDINY